MNRAVKALSQRLTYGAESKIYREYSRGLVATLAKAYERARNALEYRADNLVRRAAIERILKRLILIYKTPEEVSENLLTELEWARYIDNTRITDLKIKELNKILSKYILYTGKIPHEWVIKIASAEVEEYFNLNKDYNQFTFFAFQVIKQKVDIDDDNLDLLIYFAVDKVFAGSDPEQIAYHIINLGGYDIQKEVMEQGWDLFKLAGKSRLLPKLSKFVRKSMPPLILLRDMYFYSPDDFKNLLEDSGLFKERAHEVLDLQLNQMSGKISTAGVRSIVYVFLTKMVIAFGLETPLEKLIYGNVATLPLIINLIFPPVLMWITTMQIKIPSTNDRENLIQRTWYILKDFDNLKNDDDILKDQKSAGHHTTSYYIFSALYLIVFAGVFILIYSLLGILGFKFMSKLIFIFFLTIIAFFAYRINQIANVYYWREQGETSSLMDMISLPILTIGSILSSGLSKLNFLQFIFDFILEAPFKLILGFVDDWIHFLSTKKDQQGFD